MNTRTNKTILLIILMICLATAVYSAVGTFTFRTSGASDTTEVVDLRYPQKVPEDASVTTDSIADGSITNDKLAEPISVANGGTGKTTAAEALVALGTQPWTAGEKTQALVGSSTVDFAAKAAVIDSLQVRTSGKFLATTTVTIAAGTSLQITGLGTFATGAGGILVVYAGGLGAGATFNVFSNQTTSEVAMVGGHTFFTATKDTANRVNVYTLSGILYVQNNTAFNSQFRLSYVGVN